MASDEFVYDHSITPDLPADIMSSKLLTYVQDLNNGSYTGGIINIDSSNLSSNNRWIDWRSAYIEIPFTVAMKASTDISAASPNGYMMGLLKSGSWNLINYLSVDFQNTNIVQQTQFLNFFVNYKVITTWSRDVQKKYGATSAAEQIDTPSSFYYSAGGSANGNGISNNQLTSPNASFSTNLESYNQGLLARCYNSAYNPTGGLNSLPIQGGLTQWNTNVGQNFYTTSGSGSSTIYQFHVLATIRLRDICDFFKKVPMLKKGFFKFTIGYNAVQSMTVALTNGPTMTMSANPTLYGNTNPVLITSSATNNPMNGVATAGASSTLSIAAGIGSATIPGQTAVQNPFLTSTRLYVYSYLFTPEYEAKYIEVGQNKVVIYDDVYNYNVTSVASNQQFNSILSNTIVNPKELVVIPMINSSANGTAQLIPYFSPFDTAPATTCPLAQIYNFQVILSGDNLWQQAQLYDFDQFLSELSKDSDALQGGQSDVMSSGLIGMREWQFGYRYYVANLGRRLQKLDGVPRSIAISGKNNSSVVMDYFTFITFAKVLKLNVLTGEISLGVKE
jgi:hypothetical protein